jgi:hypothetical protein
MIIPIIHQRRFDLNAHIIRYACWSALIDPIYINLYLITMSINLGAKLVNAAQPLGFMCPNPIRLVGPSET